MNNAIPIRRCHPLDPLPVCPINAIDDDELDVRLWASILTGQRGSPVYLGNEAPVLTDPAQPAAGSNERVRQSCRVAT